MLGTVTASMMGVEVCIGSRSGLATKAGVTWLIRGWGVDCAGDEGSDSDRSTSFSLSIVTNQRPVSSIQVT